MQICHPPLAAELFISFLTACTVSSVVFILNWTDISAHLLHCTALLPSLVISQPNTAFTFLTNSEPKSLIRRPISANTSSLWRPPPFTKRHKNTRHEISSHRKYKFILSELSAELQGTELQRFHEFDKRSKLLERKQFLDWHTWVRLSGEASDAPCKSTYAPASTTASVSFTWMKKKSADQNDTHVHKKKKKKQRAALKWEVRLIYPTVSCQKYWLCTGCEFCCLPSTSQSVATDPASPASQSEPEQERRGIKKWIRKYFTTFNQTWLMLQEFIKQVIDFSEKHLHCLTINGHCIAFLS